MNLNNEKIIQWLTNRIKDHYSEDIALLLIYGSYVNGTANERSDVDFYFIPKTDRGHEMSKTFIINGIGYDLFPMSWERVEGISAFKESLTPLLANVRIEYAGSEEDLNRFTLLQKKLQNNLSDAKHMYRVANANIDKAMSKYTQLILTSSLSKTRVIAGEILMLLSDAVAYMNQTYFELGIKKRLETLEKMTHLPNNYVKLHMQIIEANSFKEIAQYALEIIKQTRLLIENMEKSTTAITSINYQEIIPIYEEILSTWNKIKVCSPEQNKDLAYFAGINLQNELDWLSDAYQMPDYDLMASYDSKDLTEFSRKAEEIRLDFVSFLEMKNVEIVDYKTLEDIK